MSSSRSAIDEALSPDDLEGLSRIMFPEEKPEEKAPPEASDAEKQQQGDPRQNMGGAAGPSRKNPDQRPQSRPSKPDAERPEVKRSKKRRRASERPTFTIGADQMATLRVVGSSRTDPLGPSASKIARRLFDLFGYNGRHPAAALHGQTLIDNASAPGPLIEERQWEDLLQEAGEMAIASNTLSEESPDGEFLDEADARLACVCFLVQEALYEAGFGDRRRRRKGPF